MYYVKKWKKVVSKKKKIKFNLRHEWGKIVLCRWAHEFFGRLIMDTLELFTFKSASGLSLVNSSYYFYAFLSSSTYLRCSYLSFYRFFLFFSLYVSNLSAFVRWFRSANSILLWWNSLRISLCFAYCYLIFYIF